jgi:predicted nucleotidyltransferase
LNAAALAPLLVVARALDDLLEHVVFVGGAVLPLLVTDTAAAAFRPTDDVDLIVHVATFIDYTRLGERLRARGFRVDVEPGAPICRWRLGDLRVDVMPDEGNVLGFKNTWYRSALARPMFFDVEGVRLPIIDAPHFCATKLEAWDDRGAADVYAHDLEDLIAVVDGRRELLAELAHAPADVDAFVAGRVRDLLQDRAFVEALPGHLPGDSGSQARLPIVERRLREIAARAR